MSPVLSQLAVPVTSVHKVEADGSRSVLPRGGRPECAGGALAARIPYIVVHVPRTHSTPCGPVPSDRTRLAGFGFTEVPEKRKYAYSFDALARTMEAFTDALGLNRYAIYVFDYGAPTGFRLAMATRNE